jgi:hypothetical protein
MPPPWLRTDPRSASMLRQIREALAVGDAAQARLDRVVCIIAPPWRRSLLHLFWDAPTASWELFATRG